MSRMTPRRITAASTVFLMAMIVMVEFALIAFGCPTISRLIEEYTAGGGQGFIAFCIGGVTVGLLVHWTKW